jgi:integrase
MARVQDVSSASIRHRVRRDGTVMFDVRYRLDGRSKTLSFTDSQGAERWATIVRRIGPAQALQLIRDEDSAQLPTLDEWAESYITSRTGLEASTVEDYRAFMRLSISPALGALPLDAISPARISAWVNDMATRYAGKTIANRHGFLYACLQAAVEDQLIPRNPCGRVRLPRTEEKEKVFLTIPEYQRLLQYVPERHRLLIELLAQTGLRWGEASALRWSDFDLQPTLDPLTGLPVQIGLLRVSRAWHHSNDRGWYIGPPKTKMSRRTLRLPSRILPQLQERIDARGDWMFTNPDGTAIRHAKFMSNVWYPAVRLANGEAAHPGRTPAPGGTWDVAPAAVPLGKRPGLHSLRHSHASWLVADGVSLAVVQARLGHESIQTTIATYTHLTPDVLAQPAASIDRLLALEP